jgi:hypothetical protein
MQAGQGLFYSGWIARQIADREGFWHREGFWALSRPKAFAITNLAGA